MRAASAPNLKSNEEAIAVIIEAIEAAGHKPGDDVMIALTSRPPSSSATAGTTSRVKVL